MQAVRKVKGDRQASESPPAPSLGEEMKTVLLGLARSNPLPLRQEPRNGNCTPSQSIKAEKPGLVSKLG